MTTESGRLTRAMQLARQEAWLRETLNLVTKAQEHAEGHTIARLTAAHSLLVHAQAEVAGRLADINEEASNETS